MMRTRRTTSMAEATEVSNASEFRDSYQVSATASAVDSELSAMRLSRMSSVDSSDPWIPGACNTACAADRPSSPSSVPLSSAATHGLFLADFSNVISYPHQGGPKIQERANRLLRAPIRDFHRACCTTGRSQIGFLSREERRRFPPLRNQQGHIGAVILPRGDVDEMVSVGNIPREYIIFSKY